jgi:hypothetical protein
MPLPLAVATAVFTASASGLAWLSRHIFIRDTDPDQPHAGFHDGPITTFAPQPGRVAIVTYWCPGCAYRLIGEELTSGVLRCPGDHISTYGETTHAH